MKPPYFMALPPAIVACLAIWLVMEHQTRLNLTGEHQALEQQCQQMEDLIARNQQLSNLLAQATAPEPLSPDQQMELLRLRGEVGLLRKQKPAFDQAREENQRAHDVLEKYREMGGTNVAATTNFWPQGTWVNAGYGTPEDAFQTSLWAGYNGDLTNFTASLSNDADTNFFNNIRQGKTTTEQSIRLADELYGLKSVQILGSEVVDDNTTVLTVELESPDLQTGRMLMKKEGGQWKLVGPQAPPP